MIRNIIFDMGGVLIDWDPDQIVARQKLTAEDARILRRELFDCSEWMALDRGTFNEAECCAAVCRRLPARLHEAAERCVYDWWKSEQTPIAGIDALIRELKGLGYGIYLLSNASSRLHEYFHRLPGADCFDGRLVSADWKLLKPQHEIYERLFEQFDLRPEECFFIDDNPLNIDGARCVGMPGAVFFRDLPRLRAELRAAGVPVAE